MFLKKVTKDKALQLGIIVHLREMPKQQTSSKSTEERQILTATKWSKKMPETAVPRTGFHKFSAEQNRQN